MTIAEAIIRELEDGWKTCNQLSGNIDAADASIRKQLSRLSKAGRILRRPTSSRAFEYSLPASSINSNLNNPTSGNSKPWTDIEDNVIVSGTKAGLSFAEIAHKIGWRSIEEIKERYDDIKQAGQDSKIDDNKEIDYQEFVRELLAQYKDMDSILNIPQREDIWSGKLEESAVLHLSDVHVGKVNWFTDLETNKGYETYNEHIMMEEMQTLIESIMSVNILLSHSYRLKTLYVFGTGDLMDNDVIVKGQRFFVEVGVGMQMVKAQRMFENFILEMLKWFENVVWVIVPGNHGRMTQRREKAPFYNSFEWLLAEMLRLAFRNESRVEIISPDSWFCLYQIYGWKFLLHHGNTVYSWMGLPYYGLQRQGKSRRAEIDVDIELIGHFHQQMEIPISSKSYTLVSGSWIEKDDWGWQKYGIFSKPEQRYFGVSPKRPRTWSFNLELKKGKKI